MAMEEESESNEEGTNEAKGQMPTTTMAHGGQLEQNGTKTTGEGEQQQNMTGHQGGEEGRRGTKGAIGKAMNGDWHGKCHWSISGVEND